MPIPQSHIISLNKSRKRAIFWKQLSNGDWVETKPLPADPDSINYYLLKGFKANPPEGEDKSNGDTIKCPLCSFEAQSAFGLSSHLRKHIQKSKKEEKLE